MAKENEVSANILFEKFDTCIMAKAIIGISIKAALKIYLNDIFGNIKEFISKETVKTFANFFMKLI